MRRSRDIGVDFDRSLGRWWKRGIFLHAANQDRARLSEQARLNNAWSKKAANLRLAQEANLKLKDASTEIQKAKAELSAYQEHQGLLSQATLLTKPSPRLLRSWLQHLSLPIGLSLSIPPSWHATETSDRLTILRSEDIGEMPWLIIARFDAVREQAWREGMTIENTSPLTYTFDQQHTLRGWRGTRPENGHNVHLFWLDTFSTSTHMLWVEDASSDTSTLLQVLATLSVQP